MDTGHLVFYIEQLTEIFGALLGHLPTWMADDVACEAEYKE